MFGRQGKLPTPGIGEWKWISEHWDSAENLFFEISEIFWKNMIDVLREEKADANDKD